MRSIFTTLFLCSCLTIFAQNGSSAQDNVGGGYNRAPSLAALERQALKSHNEGDYYASMQYYGRMMAADSLSLISLKGYGDNATLYSAFERAEWAYQKMVDNNVGNSDGSITLLLAKTKMTLGKFAEAERLYRNVMFDNKPANATQQIMDQALTGLENTNWAASVANNTELEIPVALVSDINTEYSEFAPLMVGDTLYFSSYRFPFDKDDHKPKRHLIKVLGAVQDDTQWTTTPQPYNEPTRHTAQVTFNRDKTAMYYSLCEFTGDASIRCDLYMRERKTPNSAWGAAVKLAEPINLPDYTNTEPSLGYTSDNREVLFFVSDRLEGKGKRDIWYAEKQGFGFGKPVNLSALNTAEDDVTPYYHVPSKTLYYSTAGLPTMGGLDVYASKGYGSDWTEPRHLGIPINSGGNDVYFTLTENEKTAYFASNRKGAKNLTEEACCFDIFTAELVKPQMVAVFFNKATGDSLAGVQVKLVEVVSGTKTEKSSVSVPGYFQPFALLRDRSYILIASKPGFDPDTLPFTTPAGKWPDPLVKHLYLKPHIVQLLVRVKDKDTEQDLMGTICRFVDQGPVLPNGLVSKGEEKTTTDSHEKDNIYSYTLQFNHRYDVYLSKDGYTSSATFITTEGLQGSQTIERLVYLRRGLDLIAHALDHLTKDTLDGVTFRLVERSTGETAPLFTNKTKSEHYRTVLPYEKSYFLYATKPEYFPDSVAVSTIDLEKKPFQTIVKELRLRPAELSRYMPIRLYFDNDMPKMISPYKPEEADTQYIAYFRRYIPRKEDFQDQYKLALTGLAAQQKVDSLEYFFEKEVRVGWEKLMDFSEVLYGMLMRGDKIELTLRGYASPRASASYNQRLTGRRVSSVDKHFRFHDGSIYAPFIESGQLTLKPDPRGEVTTEAISDDIKDRLNSIFSIPASRARRLEIVGFKINDRDRM